MGLTSVSFPLAVLFYSAIELATWVAVALTGMKPAGLAVGIAVSVLTSTLLAVLVLSGRKRAA